VLYRLDRDADVSPRQVREELYVSHITALPLPFTVSAGSHAC
jgi:hypothetical protein